MTTLTARSQRLYDQYGHLPIIDVSDRRAFKRCRWYWDFTSRSRHALRPLRPSLPLVFGSLMAQAMEQIYQPGPPPFNYAAGMEWWIEHAAGDLPDEAYHLGYKMLEAYAEWAPTVDDFEVVASEHAGFFPIRATHETAWEAVDDPDRFFARPGEIIGLHYYRCDAVVRDNRGRRWVMEDKTCSSWWSGTQLAFDDQFTTYALGEQEDSGEPIIGVLASFMLKHDITPVPILKSGLPSVADDRLTYVLADDYKKALLALPPGQAHIEHDTVWHRLQARELENGHPTLRRVVEFRSPEVLERMRAQILDEFLEMTNPGVRMYRTEDYRCDRCDMRALCHLRHFGEDWEQAAAATAEKREGWLVA